MDLARIRKDIDDLDGMIITLLAKRANLVSAAGKLKKNKESVRDPQRVHHVIGKARARAKEAGLDPDIAGEIYMAIVGCFMRRELMEFSEREQRPIDALGEFHSLEKDRKPCESSAVTEQDSPEFSIRRVADQDSEQVLAVFNHYVEHSFAAYPEQPVDRTFFDLMKTVMFGDAFFVIEDREKSVIGFGILKKYHPYPAFKRTAEVGYFILPQYTGQGLGARLLAALEKEAGTMGIRSLLANISSLNPQSLAFHKRHGFRECGRFEKVVTKFGKDIDIVWMQKFIEEE